MYYIHVQYPSIFLHLRAKYNPKYGTVYILTYDILGQSVSVDKLSIGAKINKLFHERLPLNLAERKIDEKNLRREIKIVIQNIRGVRSGLFTPDMAFEVIYPTFSAFKSLLLINVAYVRFHGIMDPKVKV